MIAIRMQEVKGKTLTLSFPLNGSRRFIREIKKYEINARKLHDTLRHAFEDFGRKHHSTRRHGIDGGNGAENDGLPALLRAKWQEHHRELPDFLVETGCFHLLIDNGIRFAEEICALTSNITTSEFDARKNRM